MNPKGMSDIELLEVLTGRKEMKATEMKLLMEALAELQRRFWERAKYRGPND
jgi:hypothetical protein